MGNAYPGFGANHGFSTDIDNVVSGSHLVCAYGINTGPGGNALLGCRTVIINLPVNPFGSLDGVSLEDQGPGVQSGNLTVNGWAIDPDTVDPIDVHVYLDGQLKKAVTADLARLDVWIAYPAFGSSHGYSARIEDRKSVV